MVSLLGVAEGGWHQALNGRVVTRPVLAVCRGRRGRPLGDLRRRCAGRALLGRGGGGARDQARRRRHGASCNSPSNPIFLRNASHRGSARGDRKIGWPELGELTHYRCARYG